MRPTLPILSVFMMLSACDSGVFDSHSEAHSHSSNVSGVREGVWPPEPLNMENQQRLPAELSPRARQSVVEIARSSVMNNPELLDAIGNNYGIFDGTLSVSKSDDVASFIFFNYETDETVEAVLGGDGAVSVYSQPASEWQPSENALEVEQAIELARQSLEADGHAIQDLNGTALLTYPALASSGDNTTAFYDTRMLYVTFGEGDGEAPLFSALVNMSAREVSEGGAIQ